MLNRTNSTILKIIKKDKDKNKDKIILHEELQIMPDTQLPKDTTVSDTTEQRQTAETAAKITIATGEVTQTQAEFTETLLTALNNTLTEHHKDMRNQITTAIQTLFTNPGSLSEATISYDLTNFKNVAAQLNEEIKRLLKAKHTLELEQKIRTTVQPMITRRPGSGS